MSGEKQTRANHKRAEAIARFDGLARGMLLLAALGGAVPLSGQVTPPSAAAPGDWTWMNGSNSVDGAGHYGTLGTPAGLANFPGSRWGGAGWVDNNGNLWLFAGFGYGDAATFGYLNDLWEFNPSTNSWTWMGGDKTFNANYCGDAPTYGTLGSFGPTYFPGGRQNAASWTDKNGNLWLFGGEGDGAGPPGSGGACGGAYTFGYLNDLWEFNPSTPNSATGTNGEWAWMGGSSAPSASGTYPAAMYQYTSGVAPGARYEASTWTDNTGNFWLFGGEGYDANGNFGELNDLWQFNPSLKEWAWMGGSNTVPAYSGQPGVYGTMGTPAAGNIPGGRYGASTWADSSGNLWLWGGEGIDGVGNSGGLNDLWEFNRSVGEYGEWEWMGGSSAISGSGWPGVYGTQGTPAAENIPGSRYEAVSWIDSSGHFWLFGGQVTGFANDLWAYDPSTSQWVWMDGSSTANQPGVYAPLYSPASTNIPGGRIQATSWTDKDGNLWLFGGDGRAGGSAVGALNDLWVYPPPSISFGGTAAATPTFSVASGTYTAAQTVSITDATVGATIYYTTNGTTPTTSSSVFLSSTPITVSSTETLKAIATASGDSTSAVGTAVYTITPPAATPTFSPVAGTYPSTQMVTIGDTTPGAFIFYTTNGTTPSFTGTVPNPGTTRYSGQITVSSTETIEAIATAYGYSPSAVGIAVYTIGALAPAQVTDNETITVTDAETFPDVVDAEKITVTDIESVRAYNAIVLTPSVASFNASSGNGYANHTYSVPFSATGGIGTLALTESGTLPSGITFVNGLLSGTPTAAGGPYAFSVTATDADGDSVTVQGYSLTILAASAYPAVVTDNETITVTDAETFPDVADSEPITVTDSVSVTAGLIITTASPLPGGTDGVPYSTTFNASGGSGMGYMWSATGLPAGLTMSSAGILSGTPAAASGPHSFTVKVADSAGNTNSAVFSLSINAALTITTTGPLPTLYVGSTSNLPITFTASGGSGGYLWTIAGQPSGLTMSSTGVLSGPPTVLGVFTVTVTVRDSAGDTNSVVYSLTVISPSLQVTASPTTLTIPQGQSGSTTLTFTPIGPYSESLTLSCIGLPANSQCTFTTPSGTTIPSPLQVSTPVSVVLTIKTDVTAQLAQTESAPTPPRPGAILAAIAFWWPGTMLGILALRRKRKLLAKSKRWFGLCLFALLIGTLASLAGCVSGSGFGTYVTPVGTSTVTVVVTPGSGTAQTLNIGVTITH